MRISINLADHEADALRSTAERLGVPVDQLARTAVTEFLALQHEGFEKAAARVLEKNAELYRRLA